MATIKFELTFDTETGSFSVVNTETGEIQEVSANIVKKASKKSSSKIKDDGDPTPKIILEDNKYTLNHAAASLLVDESADENRLDIKYEKDGRTQRPVIGNCESFGTKSGNKVTKSMTVACRGKAHDELANYGSIFTLEAHPTKEGLYYLIGDNNPVNSEPDGDENIALPEEDNIVENDDLNLDGLLSDDNNNDTEIDDFNFSL